MPAAGQVSLDKGEVMMHLVLAGLNRREAANDAGVSESTFRRLMRRYRVKAPRSDAKLSATKVMEILMLLKKHTRAEVAVMIGVHRRTIDQIADRETWVYVVV